MSITDILSSSVADYASVMLKGLGVALLAHGCAAVCRDCGKPSVADGVEFAGKLEILLLCLPLIVEILGTASELLSLS